MLRQRISAYLEDIDTPLGRAINLTITGLVLLSSGIFVAETYPLPELLRSQLDAIDTVVLLIFAIEYLLRLWCAENRLRYFYSLYSLIDLLAILPVFIGVFDISFIRVFRWFRILRLFRFIEGSTIFGYVSSEDGAIYTRIVFTLVSIIFVYSGLIYQVEHFRNPQAFATFLDAIYFSVSAVTTAGFGDITPISQTGRLLTVMMLLTGVVLIPWQLGDLIKRLVKTTDRSNLLCSSCGLTGHDTDARFCKRCGAELPDSATATMATSQGDRP